MLEMYPMPQKYIGSDGVFFDEMESTLTPAGEAVHSVVESLSPSVICIVLTEDAFDFGDQSSEYYLDCLKITHQQMLRDGSDEEQNRLHLALKSIMPWSHVYNQLVGTGAISMGQFLAGALMLDSRNQQRVAPDIELYECRKMIRVIVNYRNPIVRQYMREISDLAGRLNIPVLLPVRNPE